jgi:hypothetical protein
MQTHSVALASTCLFNPPNYVPLTAGVICFAMPPGTNDVYILLGLQDVQDSWCDFGGMVNKNETVECAAAREFCEESLCVALLHKDRFVSYQQYNAELTHLLQTGKYWKRIEILQRTSKDVDQVRVYFVKQIPWQPHLQTTFGSVCDKLLTTKKESPCAHPSLNPNYDVHPHCVEKIDMQWWSLDRLQSVVNNDGRYKNQRFRRSFLPVLSVVLQQFKQDGFC